MLLVGLRNSVITNRITVTKLSPIVSSQISNQWITPSGSKAFSSSSGSGKDSKDELFRPRRRTPSTYRPIQPRKLKTKGPQEPSDLSTRPTLFVIDDDSKKIPVRSRRQRGAAPDDTDYFDVVEGEEGIDEDLEDDTDWLRSRTNVDPSTVVQPEDTTDPLSRRFGPAAAEAIRHTRRFRERGATPLSIESQLRWADFMTAEDGSTEDLVMQRRAAMESTYSEEERSKFLKEVNKAVREASLDEFDLGGVGDDEMEEVDLNCPDPTKSEKDPRCQVYGDWGQVIVQVDRVQKVTRGGTIVRFRSLVIGGNCRGVAGFGIGKANTPKEATEKASRKCKRNIFFLKTNQGGVLSHDLVGKHNSCKINIRTTSPGFGLKGHPLVQDILVSFGVTDASFKSHGNRNKYNIVYATFKALMNHETIQDIALRRGKKFINLDRARRLQML